jgi:hypothetical protein
MLLESGKVPLAAFTTWWRSRWRSGYMHSERSHGKTGSKRVEKN